MFNDFETVHFPVNSCNVRNPREPGVQDSLEVYLCVIVDKRFPDECRLEYLRPYIAEDPDEEDPILYGWASINSDRWVDHCTKSIHEDDARVVAWKKVDTITPFGPSKWP